MGLVVIPHRVMCEFCAVDGIARVWRENCIDCAVDRQTQHRAETGHVTHLTAVTTEQLWSDLRAAGLLSAFGRAQISC